MPEPHETEGFGRTFADELRELAVEIVGSEEVFRAEEREREEALDPMAQAILQRVREGKKLALIFDPEDRIEEPAYRIDARGYKLIAK